jgi:hypothetical protein
LPQSGIFGSDDKKSFKAGFEECMDFSMHNEPNFWRFFVLALCAMPATITAFLA